MTRALGATMHTMALAGGLLFLASCAHHGAVDFPATYSNPILENMADPDVIEVDGTYYLYATHHMGGYDVYTSRDLVHWANKGVVFDDPRGGAWAPDLFHDRDGDGKFYLYYTDNDPDLPPSPIHKQVGVAVADSPLGPFIDRGVLVKGAIDAHLFRDDDGKMYLYYVPLPQSGIAVRPMEDAVTVGCEAIDVIRPVESWETFDGKVAEAPFMLKLGDCYYLMYSASPADSYRYAIGYATSSSPLGPFAKYPGNPVASGDDELVLGPGHHTVVQAADGKKWMIYHQKYDKQRTYRRFVALDRIWFDEMGVIHTRVSRGREMWAPVVDLP
jgi:beta-xylosidase